ncbi:MAG: hypothetical protein IPF99_10905 [Deltaproteobacteria bacterium]|nr:hypothetical protein [Deltaproteobacteria bacterium]
MRHLDPGPSLPHAAELASRVARAVEAAADDPGDVLVFLPGKAEIDACARALRSHAFEVIPLHGGLSLDEQRRGFERSARRKLILATNVAETSITLPGVGVVIDTGLVRRTRYHAGRGFLALGAIAQDSAAQRTGRAGRTGPGVCYRLWGRVAMLERATPPEIHRESLVPLVLGAAAWGRRVDALPLFDPPKATALDAAREELTLLGAIDSEGALTPRGHELYGLPLDPPLARLLIEARGNGSLDDVIDLVSALAVGRPLFLPGGPGEDDELRRGECDATALIRAVREGREREDGLSYMALGEARRIRARLRRAHGLGSAPTVAPIDREALVRTAIAADPRSVHVARVRGRSVAFSNGGHGAGARPGEPRAAGEGPRRHRGVRVARPRGGPGRSGAGDLREPGSAGRGGPGGPRPGPARSGAAGARRHRRPRRAGLRQPGDRDEGGDALGELAREAIATLFLRGSLFKQALPVTRDRLALSRLSVKLGHAAELAPSTRSGPTIEAWVAARLVELGVEGGDDLALLSSDDLLAPEVPSWVRDEVERDHLAR